MESRSLYTCARCAEEMGEVAGGSGGGERVGVLMDSYPCA